MMPDGDAGMMPAKKLFGYSILYLFAIFSAPDLADIMVGASIAAWREPEPWTTSNSSR